MNEADLQTPLGNAGGCSGSSSSISLCQQVRDSCLSWYKDHENDVRIDEAALARLSSEILQQSRDTKVEWDDEGWHYHPPNHWSLLVRRERIALYVLALDAINFCFWPSRNDGYTYEYEDLATSLTKAAEKDHETQEVIKESLSPTYILSAESLANMTTEKMSEVLGDKLPPNLSQRCQLWNEVGRVLLNEFDGSAWKMLQRSEGSSVRTVDVVFQNFPGFRDSVEIEGKQTVFFLKRAQIFVGDVKAALGEDWKALGVSDDENCLTTFADYRLPQLLRERGVMVYDPLIAKAVDEQQEIVRYSRAEISIRAATVVTVDRLTELLNAQSDEHNWTAVSVDWYLWQVGENLEAKGKLGPHHRVKTTFY